MCICIVLADAVDAVVSLWSIYQDLNPVLLGKNQMCCR